MCSHSCRYIDNVTTHYDNYALDIATCQWKLSANRWLGSTRLKYTVPVMRFDGGIWAIWHFKRFIETVIEKAV